MISNLGFRINKYFKIAVVISIIDLLVFYIVGKLNNNMFIFKLIIDNWEYISLYILILTIFIYAFDILFFYNRKIKYKVAFIFVEPFQEWNKYLYKDLEIVPEYQNLNFYYDIYKKVYDIPKIKDIMGNEILIRDIYIHLLVTNNIIIFGMFYMEKVELIMLLMTITYLIFIVIIVNIIYRRILKYYISEIYIEFIKLQKSEKKIENKLLEYIKKPDLLIEDASNIFESAKSYQSKKKKMKYIYLKEPTMEEKEEIIKMCNELKEVNEEYPFEGISNFQKVVEESYEKFYDELDLNKHIDKFNPNYANQTTYVLIDESGHIYGAANIRHELKGNLLQIGGHIGYAIRPSERGKGYGHLQLQLLIEKANEMDIDKLLITCRENNIGSKKAMEKFIGESDILVPSMYEGIMEYRYWIDVKNNLKSSAKEKNIDKNGIKTVTKR